MGAGHDFCQLDEITIRAEWPVTNRRNSSVATGSKWRTRSAPSFMGPTGRSNASGRGGTFTLHHSAAFCGRNFARWDSRGPSMSRKMIFIRTDGFADRRLWSMDFTGPNRPKNSTPLAMKNFDQRRGDYRGGPIIIKQQRVLGGNATADFAFVLRFITYRTGFQCLFQKATVSE